jgi:hypothetical protein
VFGTVFGSRVKGLRRRYPDDRLVQHSRASARRQPLRWPLHQAALGGASGQLRPKKDGRSGCMGRSRGGLTTKIHALVEGQTLPADRAYDSDPPRQSLDEQAHGPISSPCRTVRTCRPSALSSIDTETSSSASSIKSNTPAPWPRATTKRPKTSSPE